jgi:hypothetical protein
MPTAPINSERGGGAAALGSPVRPQAEDVHGDQYGNLVAAQQYEVAQQRPDRPAGASADLVLGDRPAELFKARQA